MLIDAHGHARLTDFGIAQPRDAASLTRTGQVFGTEAYIAPEVKAGEPASERSDLYALGVLLADIAREGAGAPLWALTDRLREQAPEARPKSAGEALAELERAASPLSGEMTQPFHVTEATREADEPPTAVAGARAPFEPTGLERRSGTRRPWLRIGVLVAALLLVAAAAIVIASSGNEGAKTGGTHKAAKGDGGSGQRSGDGGGSGGGGSSSAEVSTTPDATTTPAEPAAPTQTTADTGGGGGGATDGYALNDEGFALVNQGRYEEAIPVLQQAVDTLRVLRRRADLQLRALQPRQRLRRRRALRRGDPGAPGADAIRRRSARHRPGDARRGARGSRAGAHRRHLGAQAGQPGAAGADRRGAPGTPGRGRGRRCSYS